MASGDGEAEKGVSMEGREEEQGIAFVLRMLHNQIKLTIHKSLPKAEKAPRTQLQGGILGYLYHHQDRPVYQRDIEKEFRISRATATNTLQVMERDGLIVRKALDKDARLKRIQMTEAAFRDHSRLEEHMQMTERRMLEGMSREEVSQLRRLLGIMQKNLEDMTEGFEEELGPDGPGEGMRNEACEVRKDGDCIQRKTHAAEPKDSHVEGKPDAAGPKDSYVQGKPDAAEQAGSCVRRKVGAGTEDSARAAPEDSARVAPEETAAARRMAVAEKNPRERPGGSMRMTRISHEGNKRNSTGKNT